MDYNTTDSDSFGQGLRGIGLNQLVQDAVAEIAFLETIFEMKAHQPTADFTFMTYGDQVLQLYSDDTYRSNPLLGLLPKNPPRGTGLEIRLYHTDPDEAVARAANAGATILQAPVDKPHGLREACILCENGYAWVPSRSKQVADRTVFGVDPGLSDRARFAHSKGEPHDRRTDSPQYGPLAGTR